MGGIGLSSTDLNRTPHTIRTQYTHTDTHIHTYTCKHIYMHLHKNTTIQYPDTPVHKQTQYPVPDTSRTYAHTYAIETTQSYTHTHAQQSCTDKTKKTICSTEHSTQHAHNLHTHNTENTHTPQHRTAQNTEYTSSTYDLHTYSFDFYCLRVISKNSIIQIYTDFIHFGHLIDEVSKITLIYQKTLYNRNNIVIEDKI